jgi:hypothetical protein
LYQYIVLTTIAEEFVPLLALMLSVAICTTSSAAALILESTVLQLWKFSSLHNLLATTILHGCKALPDPPPRAADREEKNAIKLRARETAERFTNILHCIARVNETLLHVLYV